MPGIVTVGWICWLVFLQAAGAFVLTGDATLAVLFQEHHDHQPVALFHTPQVHPAILCHGGTLPGAADPGQAGRGRDDKLKVEMAEPANPIHTPNGSVVSYHFPARNGKPPVTVKWHEGPNVPKMPEGMDWPLPKEGGFVMVGEKGGIFHGGMRPNSPSLYPKARWEEYRSQKDQQVPKTLARIPGGIHRDWIESIKNGTKACSDFSYSGPLTETILLGSLAIRTGKGFAWDAANMEITGNPAAAALIKIEARKGWRPEDLA